MLRRITSRAFRRAASNYVPIEDQMFGINEEQIELRYQFRKFFENELPESLLRDIDKNDDFPGLRDFLKTMGNMGLNGPGISEEYGAKDNPIKSAAIIGEELSRKSAAISMSYGAHNALNVRVLDANGSHEQKLKYLPDLISGEKIGALSMTEPTAGSDVMSMKTTAVQPAGKDYYVLNGNKYWITNGPVCDTLICYAKTDPTSNAGDSITAFIVDTDAEGFTANHIPEKMGMRGSPTGDLHFDNVKVPKENILLGEGAGAFVLMRGLNIERLLGAAMPVGIMQAVVDQSFPYAHERKQFGRPIGKFQLMQGKMAEMYSSLSACRAYTYSMLKSADQDPEAMSNHECASLIMFVSDACTKVALEGIQILGGNGYVNDYPVNRYMRDAKLMEIGAGTTEVRKVILGRYFNDYFLD
ncbi:unnamed protein product [Oikopleura dioica]|uniref:Isobutyryl-CoA dehydrogenase, mitochondrial n=1 Tax=Oikopleura dioica TaxID=34765 RepID=E4WWE6_OIKDI|nr:unnamed protein product [Oikopleura dioica]